MKKKFDINFRQSSAKSHSSVACAVFISNFILKAISLYFEYQTLFFSIKLYFKTIQTKNNGYRAGIKRIRVLPYSLWAEPTTDITPMVFVCKSYEAFFYRF